jgi:type I restriction enzyme S subunit
MNDTLPNGWTIAKIFDLGELIRGVNYKKEHSSSFPKASYLPILRANNIKGKLNFDDLVYVDRKFVEAKQLIRKGDIVFAMSSGSKHLVGKSAKANSDFNGGFGAFCAVFRTDENLVSDYLAYFFQSPFFKDFIRNIASGTNINNLKRDNILEIDIPIAPLNEQKRILAKLEQLLTDLDKGIEYLETTKQQLKVYRQAVLKWAFEGKLTNELVKDGELPKGWKVTALNNVCNKIQDGSHFSPKHQFNSPGKGLYKYVTAKNIRNNYMDLSNITYVDEKFHGSIFSRCNPEFGDVLLTKDGVNTGEVTLNTLHEEFSLLSSVCLFKTKKEELLSSFLKYYFQSPLGSKMITGSMTGTAIKRIILRKIKVSEILLPPIREQYSIIQEIESRLSVCDKIEESIESCLQQAEALRLSIIKKAFEGKLVPQDTDDEPAEQLLDRIRALRQSLAKTTTRVRSQHAATKKKKEK